MTRYMKIPMKDERFEIDEEKITECKKFVSRKQAVNTYRLKVSYSAHTMESRLRSKKLLKSYLVVNSKPKTLVLHTGIDMPYELKELEVLKKKCDIKLPIFLRIPKMFDTTYEMEQFISDQTKDKFDLILIPKEQFDKIDFIETDCLISRTYQGVCYAP